MASNKRKRREEQKLKDREVVQERTKCRAELRKSYRSVNTNVETGHSEIIQKLNDLHTQVEHPRESVLDGQYVVNIGNSILKTARSYEMQSKVSSDEWIASLKDKSLSSIGKDAIPLFVYKAPAIKLLEGFIYQSRSKNMPSTQPTQQLGDDKDIANREYVADISHQLDISENAYKKAFNHKIRKMTKAVTKRDSFECNDFLVNPDSFGNTVENLFHFSFLIAEGKAKWSPSSDGQLIIKPSSEKRPPTDIPRQSSVFKITYETFKNRCQGMMEKQEQAEGEQEEEPLRDTRPTKRKRLALNRSS